MGFKEPETEEEQAALMQAQQQQQNQQDPNMVLAQAEMMNAQAQLMKANDQSQQTQIKAFTAQSQAAKSQAETVKALAETDRISDESIMRAIKLLSDVQGRASDQALKQVENFTGQANAQLPQQQAANPTSFG